jgi:hypothetical protein
MSDEKNINGVILGEEKIREGNDLAFIFNRSKKTKLFFKGKKLELNNGSCRRFILAYMDLPFICYCLCDYDLILDCGYGKKKWNYMEISLE